MKYLNILFQQLILCRWLSSCTTISDALSLAGSGVALDFHAARLLAGITFVFRADRALATATLHFLFF